MSRSHHHFSLLLTLVAAAACADTATEPLVEDPSFAMAASSASDVYALGDPPTIVDGGSHLQVNAGGVSFNLRTTGLIPGNAYTVWLVIFNDPTGCSDACGGDDLFNPAAMVDIVYGAGNVVGGSGRAGFAGRRKTGDNSGSVFGALGAPALGLIDPWTAEVHLVVRDHGPATSDWMPAQIQTFGGGCTPESSFGLGEGPFACADVQFAAHPAQG